MLRRQEASHTTSDCQNQLSLNSYMLLTGRGAGQIFTQFSSHELLKGDRLIDNPFNPC